MTMLIYDRMPAELRCVHRNAIFLFASGPSWDRLLQNGLWPEMEELIQRDMRNARSEAASDWGDQADAWVAAQRPRRYRDWYDRPAGSGL